jgi:hypothetical protein
VAFIALSAGTSMPTTVVVALTHSQSGRDTEARIMRASNNMFTSRGSVLTRAITLSTEFACPYRIAARVTALDGVTRRQHWRHVDTAVRIRGDPRGDARLVRYDAKGQRRE